MRFGKKRKLSPRFIRSFEILRNIGDVAYEYVSITIGFVTCSQCVSCIHVKEVNA